ncbi:MAG TPA: response regulator [Candidatus Limnocylindrales bacterium]|nr:response regulator [Candidatus Limnocylindrales bacterium]
MADRISRPWRRSLRSRLVAYFVVLSAITILVVGGVVYIRATDDLTHAVYDRLDSVAANKADSLDRWVDEQTRNVVYVGSIPGFGDDARAYLDPAGAAATRSAADARLRQDLLTIVRGTTDAEEIFILDLGGTIRLSTLAEHEGSTQANEAFYVDGSSHTTVQNVYTSTLTSRPTITVATPLFDQNGGGQRVAVLAANLSLARVDRIILERTGLGDSGRTYLVGTDHRLIQGANAQGAQGIVDSEGIRNVLEPRSGQGLYADDRGTPVVGVYRWLGNRGAGLLAEISQDEALGSARQLALTIGLVGLVSTLLLAAGIWVVARRVTRPILSLAATASRVAGGDLDAVSGIRSDDEVGALATAFDGMTAELRENVATLERRVAERTAELTRQRLYYASLVEVSPVAVVTMDLEERVSAWNPAATTLFGYVPDEAIGKRIDELILRSDELRAEGQDLAREALDGRVQRIGHRMRKDGSLVDVEILMVPLVVDDERLGFYAIYHDISELQAARREADDANQAKSSFLAAMSHEIRTPMNAVIGMSGLLMDTPLDAEQRDYADTIRTSGEALLTIINDILDFSKIEAGRIELDAAPFGLAGTIEGALDVMGPIAAKKGVELVYAVDPDLPATVIGDSGRLRQIVLNLLSNAIKFTEQGEVVLSVNGGRDPAAEVTAAAGAEPSDPTRSTWELRLDVHDTGIGIPPDRIGRLFQSFSQADASISRRFGGTGLGLAISRRLAELMGGSLSAESTGIAGEGSTFHMVIHLSEAGEPSAGATAGSPDAEATAGARAGIVGRRVLVVDDNATNLRILVAQLERLGLDVTATTHSREALDLATVAPADFAAVLSDYRMPDLDGAGLAAAIHAAAMPSPPPVVILSSAGQRERDAPGVAAFLSKPVKPGPLRDAVVAVLTGHAVQEAVRPERSATDPELGVRHPLRILLAEDNAVNQKLALRLLERMGYTADVAVNGLEAIEALERAPYDVVLMDVQMPELDGLEASRRIRSRWPDGNLRIVAMTANAMEGDRDACIAAGMDDYVSKPIRPDELAAALAAAGPPEHGSPDARRAAAARSIAETDAAATA